LIPEPLHIELKSPEEQKFAVGAFSCNFFSKKKKFFFFSSQIQTKKKFLKALLKIMGDYPSKKPIYELIQSLFLSFYFIFIFYYDYLSI